LGLSSATAIGLLSALVISGSAPSARASTKLTSDAPVARTVPTAPWGVSAVPGNASATIHFAKPASDGGSAVTRYVVTPFIGYYPLPGRDFHSTATTETLYGLVNAKRYAFKVAARNANGTSRQSRATTVTVGAPTAPTHVTARPNGGSARTQWTAPSTGNGSSIIGYTIRVYLAGAWQRDVHFGSAATTETVTGLTSSGAYAFRVAAQNARGLGPPSELSCVPMGAGQADIDAQPAGTKFCLSGTHNWTLTPKSGDTLTGPAVLDGGNRRQFAVVAADGVNNVTLSRLEIRDYIAGDATGAMHTPHPPLATRWTLDHLQVHDIGNGTTDGAGAELGVGWHVVGGRYFNTRQEGLTAGGDARDIVVDGAELDHNNFTNDRYTTRSHSCSDEAGGFKFVANNVIVKNSKIHDNACKGLWSDLSSTNITITNNVVYNNSDEGIFLEITGAANITRNVVFGNGFHNLNGTTGAPCGRWAWGGGITLSTSGKTHTSNGPIDISFNTVAGNCNGITGADQRRTEDNCGNAPVCELANVAVYNNRISGSSVRGAQNMTGAWQDDNDNLAKHNITFARNTFSHGAHICRQIC
jgi:parallel beta-helix repeat protein